ncbi:MAG TPA: hypothetical protein VF017_15530 [Thermoanaerobaculia bacterium]|nr:hypothetical protein [Thermoanaerobaculia bacterium]
MWIYNPQAAAGQPQTTILRDGLRSIAWTPERPLFDVPEPDARDLLHPLGACLEALPAALALERYGVDLTAGAHLGQRVAMQEGGIALVLTREARAALAKAAARAAAAAKVAAKAAKKDTETKGGE